jgi:large subunit ribosomal protein L24
VQTTLLGIAIAVILVLVSALAAPLVIDWSSYRATFEVEASRLTGLTVHVNGAIDARILPSPHFTLRDVEVGGDNSASRLHVGKVDLEIGLGPLVRGEVRASELTLVAPRLDIGLDSAGVIDWPAPSPEFRADVLAISRLDVEDGRVDFTDATSGTQLTLQNVSFNGDIRSLVGPFKGEGAFTVGKEPYAYRVNGSQADADGLKVKLSLDPSNLPLTTEVDGTLTLVHGVPQFEGVLSLLRPAGVTLADGERVMSDPWQLTGKLHATPSSASLRDMVFQYGPEERVVNFSGTADLTLGDRPHLNGEILARQLDIDRVLAAPDVTHRPPLVLIKGFLESFVAAVKPPIPVAASVAIDAMTVGGTSIQSLHGTVSFNRKDWRLDDIAFRAPGLTEIGLSGRLEATRDGFAFSGPASIETTDLQVLVAWLEGRGGQPAGSVENFKTRGDITIASDRFALDRLSASFGQDNVDGRLAYTWATPGRPASLDATLRAAKLNVDALTAFLKSAASDQAFEVPRAAVLALDIGKVTFAGVEARRVNARIKFDAGVLHVDQLSVGDLGGAGLDVSGRIDELSSQPRGQLTLDLNATTLGGVAGILDPFSPRAADTLRHFAGRLAPAKVHAVLNVDRAAPPASNARLTLDGSLGALRLTLNGDATGAPAQPGVAILRMNGKFDADDGAALVRLLDLDQVISVDQLPGQLTLAANGPLDGEIRVNGVASAGGFSAAADGALRLTGKMAPTGSLELRASAADLRPLRRTMTGHAGDAFGPVSGTAIVGIAGTDLTLTNVALGMAGKSSVHGRIDLKLANPVGIDGEIAGDAVDAAAVAAPLLGLANVASNAEKAWSSAPFGGGIFGALNGSISFKFDRAALTPLLAARDLKGVIRFKPPEIAFNELEGKLAGGRVTAGLTFRHDPQTLAAQGYVELNDANAGAFMPAPNAVEGQLSAKLQGESQGSSPEGLIGGLHGGGTIWLNRGQFAGLNPAAFDAAMRLADQSGATDAAKLRVVVGAALDGARLSVPKAEAEAAVAAGQMRLSNVKMQADGGAELKLDGLLDLENSSIDTQVVLSGPSTSSGYTRAQPNLTVRVKGPISAPERNVDVSALVGWLTLRAAEQQTRRIESLETNRRADVVGDAIRPLSPAIRLVPQGAALEINNRFNPPSTGSNGFDRLRPEAPATANVMPLPPARPTTPSPATPAPAGASAPSGDKPPAAAGAGPSPPLPAARSLLNSPLGSQN